MDFTLEDWEQLRLDQSNLFWDTALDNYQSLFLLSECPPGPCRVPGVTKPSSRPLGAVCWMKC